MLEPPEEDMKEDPWCADVPPPMRDMRAGGVEDVRCILKALDGEEDARKGGTGARVRSFHEWVLLAIELLEELRESVGCGVRVPCWRPFSYCCLRDSETRV